MVQEICKIIIGGGVMFYIQKNSEGILVVKKEEKVTLKLGLVQYINRLMIDQHVTLQGRIDALRVKFNQYKNIPIYINEECCFYSTKPLRAIDTVCINFHKVLSIREGKRNNAEVIFKNLELLELNIPYAMLIRKHLKTKDFIRQIEKTG